jgi:AcrR family transcriptional regulator
MARPRTLTEDGIIDAAEAIVREVGADRLTVRALGQRLGTDPTSMYRHFRTMDDVRRALGDRLLGDVDVSCNPAESWTHCVRTICLGIRQTQLGKPDLASLVRSAPTRLPNELRITEALLAQLLRAGLSPARAASAYHALIELTVGSAAIDATLVTSRGETYEDIYADWRSAYSALDRQRFPASTAAADELYRGGADDRFEQALDLLLSGIAARVMDGVAR